MNKETPMPRDDLERVRIANEARQRIQEATPRILRQPDMVTAARALAQIAWPDGEPAPFKDLPDLLSMSAGHPSRDDHGTFAQALTDEFNRRQAEEDAKRLAAAEEAAGQAEQKAASTGGASAFPSDEETELAHDARDGIGDDPSTQFSDEPNDDSSMVDEGGDDRKRATASEKATADNADKPAAPTPAGGEEGQDAGAKSDDMSKANVHREPPGREEPASSADGRPVQLHAIAPEGGAPETRYFLSMASAADWVHGWNGKRNIYVTVNPLRAPMDRKPKKQDIAALAQLHVDLDRKSGESAEDCVQRNLAKLRTFVPRPSRVVLSGNGVNAYWRLAIPVPIEGKNDAERVANAEKLEAYNKAIGGALDGDACFNIDRALRLPGTSNLPNKVKRAKGYVACEAKLIHQDDTAVYSLKDFAHLLPRADSSAQEEKAEAGAAAKEEPGAEHDEAVHLDSLDDIEALQGEDERTVKLRKLIETGDATLRLDPKRVGEPYPSRSEAGFAVIRALLALGVPAALIIAVFLDARWRIGDRAREEPHPRAFIEKEIERAQRKRGERVRAKTDGHGASEDEPPLPLMRKPRASKPFPMDALGAILAGAALAIGERTGAPDSMCASSVLGAAALCAQPHVDIVLPTGDVRPVSEFFLTVAVSGERKSTVDNLALAAAYSYEARHEAGYSSAMRGHRDDVDTWKAMRAKTEKAHKGVAGALHAALAAIGPEPEAPLDPMLLIPEPTYPGMVMLFSRGRGSLGLFADEGGLFIGGHGMKSEAKLETVSGLSSTWDGTAIKRIRVGEKSLSLRGRRLSVHLMAQPEVADILLNDTLIRGQGLLSRILTAAPTSTMGSRAGAGPSSAGDIALSRYDECLERLLERPWPTAPGTRNELAPRLLRMSPEAAELWQAFADEVEGNLGPDGPLTPIAGLANKLAEHAARLAAVLAVVDNPAVVRTEARQLEAAIAIASFYGGEGLRLAEASRLSPSLLLAQKLLNWLHGAWGEPLVSLPDICWLGPYALRESKEVAERAIAILADHGWLVRIDGKAEVKGRVRQKVWRIRK
jgi:hypothetical protein